MVCEGAARAVRRRHPLCGPPVACGGGRPDPLPCYATLATCNTRIVWCCGLMTIGCGRGQPPPPRPNPCPPPPPLFYCIPGTVDWGRKSPELLPTGGSCQWPGDRHRDLVLLGGRWPPALTGAGRPYCSPDPADPSWCASSECPPVLWTHTPPPPGAGVGKPCVDTECASGCTWSTARAAARL